MPNKILIVDDDIDILEPISLLLEDEGYTIECISDGEQTYEKTEAFKPDLILLDVLMSGTDGRAICKELKDSEATQKIPIIMMSAHPNVENDAKKFGADGFVAKPFESENLIKTVRNYIKN